MGAKNAIIHVLELLSDTTRHYRLSTAVIASLLLFWPFSLPLLRWPSDRRSPPELMNALIYTVALVKSVGIPSGHDNC